VNELELLASLRDEVPPQDSSRIEHAVMTAIRPAASAAPAGTRRPPRRRRLRPVLAGGLAVAVGAGVYVAVQLSGDQGPGYQPPQVVAWSGKPTAAWPAGPSYGRANTAAQLIGYVTRSATAAPGRGPRPGEWVVVKTEYADSSQGSGGYIFGPPDERKISLAWYRSDGCAAASVPDVPASLPAARTVTGKLTIDSNHYYGPGCAGTTLGGWKSVTYSYLSSLPTDPAALESVLLAGDPPGGLIPTREDAIFDAIYSLLSAGEPTGVVVPRKLEAALYRVLQQLPGVHFEPAVDLAGRTGLGFWMVREGYLKQEIVIDPLTYAFMGYQDVAIKNHAMVGTDGTRYVTKGHVMGWGALLGIAIVRHPGQLP
jgi:hypothetical protein